MAWIYKASLYKFQEIYWRLKKEVCDLFVPVFVAEFRKTSLLAYCLLSLQDEVMKIAILNMEFQRFCDLGEGFVTLGLRELSLPCDSLEV